MFAARLSRLTRDIRRYRSIPIAHVQDFPKRRAVILAKAGSAGSKDCVGVTTAFGRGQIKERLAFRSCRERVREGRDMQFPPPPCRRVVAESLPRLFHSLF